MITGESEFVEQLLPGAFPEDLQPLANCGHDVLVYHNGLGELNKTLPKGVKKRSPFPLERSRVECKSDGW